MSVVRSRSWCVADSVAVSVARTSVESMGCVTARCLRRVVDHTRSEPPRRGGKRKWPSHERARFPLRIDRHRIKDTIVQIGPPTVRPVGASLSCSRCH